MAANIAIVHRPAKDIRRIYRYNFPHCRRNARDQDLYCVSHTAFLRKPSRSKSPRA